MIERILGGIPTWMRADHPMMRQRLEQEPGNSRRSQTRRLMGTMFLLSLLLVGGYFYASDFFTVDPLDMPISELLQEWLIWPVLVVQVALQIIVIMVTVNAIGAERKRQTWDSLRTTTEGASMLMRSRWAYLVFYELRFAVILLTIARLVFIGALLYDLTGFQGEYLRNLAGKAVPSLSVPLAIAVVTLTLTATLILPITSLGLNTAFGLLLSTFIKQRTYGVLAQVSLIVIRVALVTMLAVAVTSFRADIVNFDNLLGWLVLFGFAIFGDWGITLLWLSFYGGTVWREIPYGYLLGVALIAWVIVQAILADLLMAWAVRRAEVID